MLKLVSSLFLILTTFIYASAGYEIDNYKINVQVNEQNVYRVEENININFIEPRRGIFRIIPLKFNNRRIRISDIRVNAPTNIQRVGSDMEIRIGDPNRYITGLKQYIINYNYNLGNDKNPDYDEVYYNLVGNDWDTTIKKVEFEIELPKEFDASKINFTLGKQGSINTQGVNWTVRGNTIKGYTTVTLAPSESLTLALPLPEGYFNVSTNNLLAYIAKALLLFIYILIPGLAFKSYLKYKDKNRVVEVVEFYPPDNLTPSELGYYIDEVIDPSDITSLIFYWANKGYLKINELKKGGLFSKDEFEIEFLKPLESEKDFEKCVYNGLLAYKDTENKVRINELKQKFYKTILKAAEILEIYLVINQKDLYTAKSLREGRNARAKIIIIIFAFIGYVIFNVISYDSGIIDSYNMFLPIVLGIVSIIATISFASKIKALTDYSSKILGRVQGFKRFLETAEKRKLESLIDDNPSYFYNILPYTIVLGVSAKWADKFKDLVTAPPQWYSGPSGVGRQFALGAFMGSFNSSLSSMNNSMLSQPQAARSSSNYGGGRSSSRGGSSGGGAGGGGGRSW